MTTVQTRAASAATCWSCKAETRGEHFCPACGKIQPLPPGTDYFAFFGLPRKLRLDAADLEKRFHQLSWKLHPDNFTNAEKHEQALSLERSSQLNDAFRTLQDPIRRVEYLLLQAGLRKEGKNKQQAPPELLEEVFELNEWLDELRSARQAGDGNLLGLRAKLEAAEKNFEAKLAEVDAGLDRVFADWDAALDVRADDGEQKRLMARMNELLNRRSYIRNLVANVRQELLEA
jgi:molecular chaperone HscB